MARAARSAGHQRGKRIYTSTPLRSMRSSAHRAVCNKFDCSTGPLPSTLQQATTTTGGAFETSIRHGERNVRSPVATTVPEHGAQTCPLGPTAADSSINSITTSPWHSTSAPFPGLSHSRKNIPDHGPMYTVGSSRIVKTDGWHVNVCRMSQRML